MAHFFPVALKLQDRPCLVVGSSSEAASRTSALLEAGARVTVISSAPGPELAALTHPNLTLRHRSAHAGDLDGIWVAVLADRDPALEEALGRAAEEKRVLFCAVDRPQRGSFAHMALARAGLVSVAISTEGQAPALGRRLRQELQRLMDRAGLAAFADRLAALRARTPPEARREVLGKAVAGLCIEGSLSLEE